jgi:hypothetical protein
MEGAARATPRPLLGVGAVREGLVEVGEEFLGGRGFG